MNKIIGVVCLLYVASFAFAQEDNHIHIMRPANGSPNQPAASFSIDYHSGPILNKTTSAYVIYYGNWPTNSQNIINSFLGKLSGTGLHNIQTTYYDSAGVHIQNVVKYGSKNIFHDNYSLGKSLTDADLQTIVSNAISGGHLPANAEGVYFILTAKDVTVNALGGSFCSLFCGYHSPSTSIVTGETINYAMVGNPARCPSGCAGNTVIGDKNSPNNDIGGDGAVSIIFHELSESETDPQFGIAYGWGPPDTSEEGDDCNFVFGTLKVASNGSHYNQTIGTKNFLIQEMLALKNPTGNNNSGTCVQSH